MGTKTETESRLHSKATELQFDRRFLSQTPKRGYIPIQMGWYRNAKAHKKIVDLLSSAMKSASSVDYYLLLRAGIHLSARHLDHAERDYMGVIEGGGMYVTPARFGLVSVYLAMGERARAQSALDHANADEKKAGRPTKELDDFEVWWQE